MSQIHIPSFAPEVIFHIGPIAITNTIINVWMAILVFLALGLFIRKNIKNKPKKSPHKINKRLVKKKEPNFFFQHLVKRLQQKILQNT